MEGKAEQFDPPIWMCSVWSKYRVYCDVMTKLQVSVLQAISSKKSLMNY